jgi:FKBP-type peptidyl-prolyl cis-trans isomerase
MNYSYIWGKQAFMKYSICTLPALGFLALAMSSCGSSKKSNETSVSLDSLDQRISYAIGFDVAQNLKQQGFEVDPEIVSRGVMDGLADSSATTLMTPEEVRNTFNEFQQEMSKRQQRKMEADAAPNVAAGQEYMAQEAAREGVQRTASGLLYEEIKPGSGPKPNASNTVKVHYEGTLMDGTVFDSSYERGEPATFPLNGVIQGWTEGLQLMPVGSTYRLIIPAELGYGNSPPPGSPIQPGSVLVFKVELLEIVQ